jgi:hypothetical protein
MINFLDYMGKSGGRMSFYSIKQEQEPDTCIGFFKVESKCIKPGRVNSYFADLTNCTNDVKKILIIFDIYKYPSSEPSSHSDCHYAYFSKWISINPKTTTLKIEYDWINDLKFYVNNSVVDYDEKWKGKINDEGLYSIFLVLMDENKNKISETYLIQELTAFDSAVFEILENFSYLSVFCDDSLDDFSNSFLFGNQEILTQDNKNILFINGKDKESVRETIYYFSKFCNFNKNIKLFSPKLDDEMIRSCCDSNIILKNCEFSYEDALKRSFVLCDPSVNSFDLHNLLLGWMNRIPLLVNEKSPLKSLCTITNSGLYFNNYDEFESCLNILYKNASLRNKICNNNNVLLGLEFYEWFYFLRNLKQYLRNENNEHWNRKQ